MIIKYPIEIDGLGVVLFMGRSGCFYSKKIKKLLEKNSKKLGNAFKQSGDGAI